MLVSAMHNLYYIFPFSSIVVFLFFPYQIFISKFAKKKKQTKANKQKRIYAQSFNFLYKVENISYILQVTLNLIY